jgi:hypothetical protein
VFMKINTRRNSLACQYWRWIFGADPGLYWASHTLSPHPNSGLGGHSAAVKARPHYRPQRALLMSLMASCPPPSYIFSLKLEVLSLWCYITE